MSDVLPYSPWHAFGLQQEAAFFGFSCSAFGFHEAL